MSFYTSFSQLGLIDSKENFIDFCIPFENFGFGFESENFYEFYLFQKNFLEFFSLYFKKEKISTRIELFELEKLLNTPL